MAPHCSKQAIQAAAEVSSEHQNETASVAPPISGNKRLSRPTTTISNEDIDNKRRKVVAATAAAATSTTNTSNVSSRTGGDGEKSQSVIKNLYDSFCDKMRYVLPPSEILPLIEEGGKDLALSKNYKRIIPLHVALKAYKPSTEVVSKLVEFGGSQYVLYRSNTWNSLHYYVCSRRYDCNHIDRISADVLDLLSNHGGEKLFTHRNRDNKTAVQQILTTDTKQLNKEQMKVFIADAAMVMDRGIQQLQDKGRKYEYALGGLFNLNSNDGVIDEVLDNWNVVLLTLERVMALRPQNRQLPIIQAFIVNKVPPNVIRRVFGRFEEQCKPWDLERMDFRGESSMENFAENFIQKQISIINSESQRIIKDVVSSFSESVNTMNSLNQYPIDVAVERQLGWNEGMKDIVEVFASYQQSLSALTVCAKHGVKWEDGTAAVVDEAGRDEVRRADEATGLYPFMLAGVGGKYHCDFDSVFHLIKLSPESVRRYDVTNQE